MSWRETQQSHMPINFAIASLATVKPVENRKWGNSLFLSVSSHLHLPRQQAHARNARKCIRSKEKTFPSISGAWLAAIRGGGREKEISFASSSFPPPTTVQGKNHCIYWSSVLPINKHGPISYKISLSWCFMDIWTTKMHDFDLTQQVVLMLFLYVKIFL